MTCGKAELLDPLPWIINKQQYLLFVHGVLGLTDDAAVESFTAHVLQRAATPGAGSLIMVWQASHFRL